MAGSRSTRIGNRGRPRGRTTDPGDPDRDDRDGRKYFPPQKPASEAARTWTGRHHAGDQRSETQVRPRGNAVFTALKGNNAECTAWSRTGGVPAVLLVSPISIPISLRSPSEVPNTTPNPSVSRANWLVRYAQPLMSVVHCSWIRLPLRVRERWRAL